MTGLCALCLTALLAAFARLAESVSPVVRCEPCDTGAMVLCKPLPLDCAEPVKEPGCGCCLTCPLTEGQACGVYTGRCGSGLTCQHRPGESKPLQALLEGRGVCVKAPDKKPSNPPNGDDDSNGTRATTTEEAETPRTTVVSGDIQGGDRVIYEPSDSIIKIIIKKDNNKKSQSFKGEPVSSGVHTDIHNFSLESKRETEYGPCRREMEMVIKNLKISNVLSPRGFRIPNCDQKGFYKKKQCRPSKGRKRGQCWCVDKYGQPIPGYDGKEKVHCLSMETK